VEGLKLIEKQIKLKEEFKDFFQMVKSWLWYFY
jgi:2-hydroxy-3-keto-5-methylthiopentenyl-1-phosphate phosphatase